MSNRIAYFISCSEHYDHRFRIVDDLLRSRGYHTIYVTSDFDHTSKQRFVTSVSGGVQLPVLAYRSNLSIQRILSHFQFAVRVYAYLEALEQEPDLIVALLPPNFLGHYLGKYKKKHPRTKLIFDIFDMWPETFPSTGMKKLLAPAFAVWAWLRDHSLSCADWVITECELFRNLLGLPDEKSGAIYLSAEPLRIEAKTPELREDVLDVCYLGSINNVIGIDEICEFLQSLTAKKKVNVHIVGFGEKQQEFMERVKDTGAEAIHYGPIYDEGRKQDIINRCHFGLNIMKKDVCIGLTMKSVDYFRHGLPIVSNIGADTQRLLRENKVGFQLSSDCEEQILQTTGDEWLEMRQNVHSMFEKTFSNEAITQQYQKLLTDIL